MNVISPHKIQLLMNYIVLDCVFLRFPCCCCCCCSYSFCAGLLVFFAHFFALWAIKSTFVWRRRHKLHYKRIRRVQNTIKWNCAQQWTHKSLLYIVMHAANSTKHHQQQQQLNRCHHHRHQQRHRFTHIAKMIVRLICPALNKFICLKAYFLIN